MEKRSQRGWDGFNRLHATILHLLGLDHPRLTYRHAGREMRLTDIKGGHRAVLG